MTEKQCRRCKVTKPSGQFSPDNRNRDGLQAYCKPCVLEYQRKRRAHPSEADLAMKKKHSDLYYERHKPAINAKEQNRKLKSRYGITMEDYERMVLEQEGKCGICETSEPGGRGKRFHVDHDHETGEVRGLLCWICNKHLGIIENKQFMEAAMKWLEN